MRISRPIVSASLVSICFAAGGQEKIANTQKPNVILIYIDDMGYSDIEIYGGRSLLSGEILP